MKPKSLKQYAKEYEKTTGDKIVWRPDYTVVYLAERGFITYKPDYEGEMLVVEFTVGDGKFFRHYAEIKAGELGLKYVGTFCNRNIEAYLRNFGCEILDKQEINGQKRYLCQDALGRKVTATFKCDRRNGLEPEYYVVLYLFEKAITRPKFGLLTKGDE